MKKLLLALILLVILSQSAMAVDWKRELDALVRITNSDNQEEMIRSVLTAGASWQQLSEHLQSIAFPEVLDRGVFLERQTLCTDGVKRPCVVYIPASYQHQVATPLLVVLHGGVSRKEIKDEPIKYAEKSHWVKEAEENGWFLLFPFGQSGATWWDEVGMANIHQSMLGVKKDFNIDDNRVWMGGFSDGASASFLHAMVAPTDYAAFVALNGHMGVGSLDGNLPTYVPNLANTPMYAVTTKDDGLYPSKKMRPTIQMAMNIGANIFYRELPGEHNDDDIKEEFPVVSRFLMRHSRNPHPHSIVWESARPQFGKCRWFSIDAVKNAPKAVWHKDHNVIMQDDRVSFGFFPETCTFAVKIGKVLPDTFAASLPLKEGDFLIGVNDSVITSNADLDTVKATLKRGEKAKVKVRRGTAEVLLVGQIPEVELYHLFRRDKPSAAVRVNYLANHVEIKGSRVSSFTVYVHPDQFRLEDKITISLNGWNLFDDKVYPDREYLLRNFLKNRDRKLLYVAKIHLKVE